MRPAERQQEIVDLINQAGTASVDMLCDRFAASAETIRRDLGQLSASGKVRKIHGGATRVNYLGEGPFYQRLRENVAAKRTIAKLAAEKIRPGDSLFIDTGTTTLLFAEELARVDGLTVITNSIDVIRTLDQGGGSDLNLYLLGGRYHGINGETLGSDTVAQVDAYHPHHAVITAGAIDSAAGVTDYNAEEAKLASSMMRNATHKVVLADSTKFGLTGGHRVTQLDEIDCLVSEIQPSGTLLDALQGGDVEMLYSSSPNTGGEQ